MYMCTMFYMSLRIHCATTPLTACAYSVLLLGNLLRQQARNTTKHTHSHTTHRWGWFFGGFCAGRLAEGDVDGDVFGGIDIYVLLCMKYATSESAWCVGLIARKAKWTWPFVARVSNIAMHLEISREF